MIIHNIMYKVYNIIYSEYLFMNYDLLLHNVYLKFNCIVSISTEN